MLLIFILANLLFIYFFWKINFLYWVYIVVFFLSVVIFASFFSVEWKNNWKEFLKWFFLEYITYINFFVILAGISFILKYFVSLYDTGLIVDIKILLILIFSTSLLILLAILFNKQTLVQVAFFWQFVLWILLWFLIKDIKIFYYAVAYLNALSVVSYLLYFIRFAKISRYLSYMIFLLSLIVFFIILAKYFISSTIILSFAVQFVIFMILIFVIKINNLYNKILELKKKEKEMEYDLRLFWEVKEALTKEEKIFLEKHNNYFDIYEFIVDFFVNSPTPIKIIFSLTNTIPIIIASWAFFHDLESANRIQNEIFYWMGAIMYFINFLLFKKLDWFVIIQRLFAFFVINFVTYFTIIDFSGKNYLYIAIWWIIWNLFATVIILFLDKKHNTFNAMDYLIWSIVNFMWLFINIYFLFKIWLSYYLSVWIALLYVWLYLYLYRIVYKKYFLE